MRVADRATFGNHVVQTFQTTDLIEARACRRAQFSGWIKTLNVGGASITGLVHSVKEDSLCNPALWTIQIIAKEQLTFEHQRRYTAARR
jgi:hypothetical protein